MKILLSYSVAHFNPHAGPAEHRYWGSSANVLARTLYEILGEMGEVTYVDADDVQAVEGKSFDLMVGVIKNFGSMLDAAQVARSVLFAVNMHPAERHKLLLDFVARARLPSSALHGWDLPDVTTASADVARADTVLAVGNVRTFNSYAEHGVDKRKLRVLNYATAAPEADLVDREPGPARLLYLASEIGVRKGFDLLEHAIKGAASAGAEFHLDIVGAPGHGYYQQRLQGFIEALGERVRWHGWLDADSPDYDSVLRQSDFLLFPSLEEGQAGTVLDGLARGVIPVVSTAAGVDFSPLGTFDTTPAAPRNIHLVTEICGTAPVEIERLRRKATEYYTELHVPFREPLTDALRGAAEGEPWPRASVVLAVFNKESTITRLLELLDRGLTSYGNADLHIILDGCTDRTPARVQEFLSKQPSYATKISVTPDIFEVKTNNIGLMDAEGAYGVIVQDDNLVYDPDFLFEAVTFMERDRQAAVLGGLAGVNFYPRGTRGLSGPGQIAMDELEVYWRQDADTNPELRHRIFQVDACMRGPLILRKSFLEAHGYLDEAFAPLYQDDMDLCLRAADRGFKVYCALMDVENDSGTMGQYSPERWEWLKPIMERNSDLFYQRWTPSTEKDYLWINRTRITSSGQSPRESLSELAIRARRRWIGARKTWLHLGFLHPLVVRAQGLRVRFRGRD